MNAPLFKRCRLVRGEILCLHRRAGWSRRAVGRRSHSPAHSSAGLLQLAGRGEPANGSRLPACGLLARHLDLGDSPDHRQSHRPLVLRHQSGARAPSTARCESRARLLAQYQDQLRLHAWSAPGERAYARRGRRPSRPVAATYSMLEAPPATCGDDLIGKERPRPAPRRLGELRSPAIGDRCGTFENVRGTEEGFVYQLGRSKTTEAAACVPRT